MGVQDGGMHMCDSVVARIFRCDKCGFKVRSDWKFCPNCASGIYCICDQPEPAAKLRAKKTVGGTCGCGGHNEPSKTVKKGAQTVKGK